MSKPGRRLPQIGLVDRSKPITFVFNGRSYQGYAGDTLASALLANSQRLVARSFKFHRPRGIVAAGWEEPNALVRVHGPQPQPLALATTLKLEPGLDCASVNVWPSVRFDLGAINDRLRRGLPAGFYYKTFMWPARAWPAYEWLIRRMAGLGVVPAEGRSNQADRQTRQDGLGPLGDTVVAPRPIGARPMRVFCHTDLLVIGSGVAGLAAAAVAAQAGVRTLLIDDQDQPALAVDSNLHDWRNQIVAELDGLAHVTRLSNTLALGCYDHGYVTALQRLAGGRTRLLRIRARQTIVATGAAERPLLFADNDRPGIMLSSAVVEYLERYGVACGDAVLIVGNHSSAYDAACRMSEAGLRVVAIADERSEIEPENRRRIDAIGIPVYAGYQVCRVLGRHSVRGAHLAPMGAGGNGSKLIECDLIAMAGGWSPRVHLFSQSGGKVHHDAARAAFVPGQPAQAAICAGAANGLQDAGQCRHDGWTAGAAAARALGFTLAQTLQEAAMTPGSRPAADIQQAAGVPLKRVDSAGVAARVFVDFANDVTTLDLALAVREGFESVEHVKRYTTLGMGVDQGKSANVNAIGVLAGLRNDQPGNVGTTTFRPPYVPVPFAAIAGSDPGPLVRPLRTTPMSPWHVAAGAVMYESGANWRRPGYYPQPGETMAQAVRRECLAVRQRVGIYDSSPLGKIEVRGEGAGAFLDFVYAGQVSDLLPRQGRYGLMLREDGRLFDDGVVFCLSEARYWVSTTAGNADAVAAWLEYVRQQLWKGAPVCLIPVTAQWANAVICGPQARAVLQAAGTDIDLAADQFSFMAVREGRVAGLEARVFRVSFTGELSFEINVPARHGLLLWQRLLAAGADAGIAAIGSEANHVMRVEKGYLSIGHEADGLVTPRDLGLGWAVRMNKPDFIGRRSLARSAPPLPRRQLVGLLPDDTARPLPEGAQICAAGSRTSQGFVTASVMSTALDRSIALALLDDGQARHGERVNVTVETAPGKLGFSAATVVKPAFYDPAGARLRG